MNELAKKKCKKYKPTFDEVSRRRMRFERDEMKAKESLLIDLMEDENDSDNE